MFLVSSLLEYSCRVSTNIKVLNIGSVCMKLILPTYKINVYLRMLTNYEVGMSLVDSMYKGGTHGIMCLKLIHISSMKLCV